MKAVAVVAFLSGLLLAVRVMFFGVRRVAGDQLHHRRWPLATAAFLVTAGAMSYAHAARGAEVTAVWIAGVVLIGVVAGAGAWWLVKRSAAIPSTDPEDDPRYRFQGHVARVIQAIEPTVAGAAQAGRIAFSFDGERHEFDARWSTEAGEFERHDLGEVESEVVIERIEGGTAYVEPWTVVEERL
jgi:hypothetical protein